MSNKEFLLKETLRVKTALTNLIESVNLELSQLESNGELSAEFLDKHTQKFLDLQTKTELFFLKCKELGWPTQWTPLLNFAEESFEDSDLVTSILYCFSLWEKLIQIDRSFMTELQSRYLYLSEQLHKIKQGKHAKGAYQDSVNMPAVFFDHKK